MVLLLSSEITSSKSMDVLEASVKGSPIGKIRQELPFVPTVWRCFERK
jgi:hypothetical protein